MEVSSSSGYDLTFKGPNPPAFSCVKVRLYQDGTVSALPPVPDVVSAVKASEKTVLYSPDRLLFTERVELLGLE